MRFDVAGLDAPLAERRHLLLKAEPGVDPQPFVCQAVRRRLRDGGDVVYLTTDRSPARILEGLGPTADQAPIHFLDAYGAFLGQPTNDPVDARNVQVLERRLARLAEDVPHSLAVIDSLSGLALQAGSERTQAWLGRLRHVLERFEESLVVLVDWQDEILDASVFPDVVHLSGVEERIITHSYVRLDAVAGKAIDAPPLMYRVRGEAINVYVPKVVVAGVLGAGKSTFLRTVCDNVATTERKGTTVAGERGHARVGGVDVEMFGTPGHERFDPLLPTLLGQAVGVILVINATRPQDFQRAVVILRLVHQQARHVLVVANMQDQPGAVAPAAIAQALGVRRDEVLACDARDPDQARAALKRLVTMIMPGAIP